MNRESKRGPIVFLPNGTQKRVGGYQDLKIGDIFSVAGLPKRKVVEGPTKIVKDGKTAWHIRGEHI